VAAVLVLTLLLLAGVVAWPRLQDRTSSGAATTTAAGSPADPARDPAWGLAGPYTGVDPADLRRRGIRLVLLELSWARAEPDPGRFDRTYLAAARRQLGAWRSQGLQVALNYGLHEAPAWLLARPNARFVNQDGDAWSGDQANLVWAKEYRRDAERYTARVFAELVTGFATVRVGGGPLGELGYPGVRRSDGSIENRYWAFDGAAARTNPAPGWKPCDPAPAERVRRFLDWYLDALVDFQNWQVATVRRSYPGTIAVLYPSWGIRPGDLEVAAAAGLCGRSRVERSGEIQRGYAHARQIGALTDPAVAVWGTWMENTATIARLAELADTRGLAKMGENSGHDAPAELAGAVHAARVYRLSAFLWIRAEQAYCRCSGWATIDDYEAQIRT
jgi:hypothetical protein